MGTLTAGLLLAWLASSPPALAARPPRVLAEPPAILNVVRHKLKPGSTHSYEALEAAIVAAYEQAHLPVFWIMLQSRTDATDVIYLNVADSIDEWESLPGRFRKAAAGHPELERMSTRLATFIERSTNTLTTRRDEIPFRRTGVDLQSMGALRLTVFDVKAGHEGRFVSAARTAAASGAPWLMYEANDAPTFMLVTPLKSASRVRKLPAVPRRLQELSEGLAPTADGVYAVRQQMSRPPKGWRVR